MTLDELIDALSELKRRGASGLAHVELRVADYLEGGEEAIHVDRSLHDVRFDKTVQLVDHDR